MEQVQQLVQPEQLRQKHERTSFLEQEVSWKLKYELQQQEFARATQEWRSREQLLLKLLRESQRPRICVDIQEMCDVSIPDPQTTHLNEQVTQITLGSPADCVRPGDNTYHCVVTLTVEKSPAVEEVLNASSQTVEDTPAVEMCEVQEPQGVSEAIDLISPEPEEPATQAEAEEAKAGLEEGFEPTSVAEDVPDDWFTSSVYTQEELVVVLQETDLKPTLTEAEDEPDDWFTSSVYTEMEAATVPQDPSEASPVHRVQSEEVNQDTAAPATKIARKAKKKKRNKQNHYDDQPEEDNDYFHDYGAQYLQKGKARANVKNIRWEGRDWSCEANSRKKNNRKHWA